MNRQKILFSGLFALCAYACDAQSISPSTINSSGSSQVVGGNTYESSIGEMTLVSTAGSGSIIVTQGLLQPAANGSGIKDRLIADDELSVFPVPSASELYIQPEFNTRGKLSYVLLDAAGKNVLQSSATLSSGKERQHLNMGNIASGNYLLNITYESAGQTSIKAFKVQKTQ